MTVESPTEPPLHTHPPKPAGAGGWVMSFVLCCGMTAAAIWAGAHTFGSKMQIHHVEGQLVNAVFDTGQENLPVQGSKSGYTRFEVIDRMGYTRGPFKLADNRVDDLASITAPVRVMYDQNKLVVELKTEGRMLSNTGSYVRKRHMARVVAMILLVIFGVFALAMWTGFVKSILARWGMGE